MTIEIITNNTKLNNDITESDINDAQVWGNKDGSTIMSIPGLLSAATGFYIVLAILPNGAIKYGSTMRKSELVNHLNKCSFEEINCTIELNF